MFTEEILISLAHDYHFDYPPEAPIIIKTDNQLHLKVISAFNQGYKCICGEPLNSISQLHHALISRKDVMGSPNKNLIHNLFNVLVLHPDCHYQTNRKECFLTLKEIYGIQNVLDWYTEFPMKTRRMKLDE